MRAVLQRLGMGRDDFDLVNDSNSSAHGVRGGDWTAPVSGLVSLVRHSDGHPFFRYLNVGFRVASIAGLAPTRAFDSEIDVDDFDFLAWQQNPNLGSLSDREANYELPVATSATTISEPASMTLAVVIIAISNARLRC